MNIFKKEPTIEFFSLIPEVAEIAPIVPAYNFRPSLHVNSAKALSERKKDPSYGLYPRKETAKCPGIYNYVKHGWVMTTWQDILIKTNGDGVNFEWVTNVNQNSFALTSTVGDTVSAHPPFQYADYVAEDKNTLKFVLKINTPWRCLVPEGYYLMEKGLPYTDERRFTTVEGFFSNEYGVAQMNVQLLWHVMEGETLIKAGTPIAHYMLIPKNQPKLIVRGATKEDIRQEKLTTLEITRKNVSNKSESKCIYAKLFGKRV